ncbi:MAG: hypothetical protein JWQ50_118 [Caballeronia mineralivorans]|nr:hypothetical protein [Caballeronia mineralivorans]
MGYLEEGRRKNLERGEIANDAAMPGARPGLLRSYICIAFRMALTGARASSSKRMICRLTVRAVDAILRLPTTMAAWARFQTGHR